VNAEGIALVTGASRGLGRAIALELAACGFEVVATMRDPAAGSDLPRLAAKRGGRLRVERLDVTAPGAIEMPAGLRVLVNNAGVEREFLPVEHQPLEQYRFIYETNVFGCLRTIQAAIPGLKASGGGVICNVTTSSYLAPMPFYAAYRSSKAALSAIGESLLVELAPFGIRVVEIMPGPIDTDMLAGSARMPEAARHPGYGAMAQKAYDSRMAVGPSVTSPEVAAARVRAAILDDRAPLRSGCDPMADGLLEAWRTSRDEDLIRGFRKAFVP
jgi:NAD(P)-dependent dehydrogenase (short-subunit alcohol dehydrogenase family)